jgi:predicted type IV restriction endonuclease
MQRIPKKVIDRYIKVVPRFQKILANALARDVNEADTVLITQDMLAEIFGFDKYQEITSEYAIRNTFVDLAIKLDDKVQYLIEVKAIGLQLKASHLRQVINYGANNGIQWVVLTNGIKWEVYRIRFEKPIGYDLVYSFDMQGVNPRNADDQQKMFLLSKKGILESSRDEYFVRVQSVNRFTIGALLQSDDVIKLVRRDLRKLAGGVKVDIDEIQTIISNEVLKRDILEGEEARKALVKIRRMSHKPRPQKLAQNEDASIEMPEQVQEL